MTMLWDRERQPDKRVRFAHSAPIHCELDGAVRPKRREVDYFIRRMEQELDRNRRVLAAEELAEYEQALRIYRKRPNPPNDPSRMPPLYGNIERSIAGPINHAGGSSGCLERLATEQATGLGPADIETLLAKRYLVAQLRRTGQIDQAVRVGSEHLEVLRQVGAKKDHRIAGLMEELGMTLLDAHRPNDAEVVLRESLLMREETRPESKSTSQVLLGAALLAQKNNAAAEPFLLAGFQGLSRVARELDVKAWRLPVEAVQYIAELYGTMKRPEDVAKWRSLFKSDGASDIPLIAARHSKWFSTVPHFLIPKGE